MSISNWGMSISNWGMSISNWCRGNSDWRRRKRSKLKAGPNIHHDLFLGLKSNSYPCNKRHSIRVIASIPRGLSPDEDGDQLPGELRNLQLVIAICLETRQVPVRICYALKIRSP